MAEHQRTSLGKDQAGGFRLKQRGRRDPERTSCREDDVRLPSAFGGGHQQQELGRRREAVNPRKEDRFQVLPERHRAWERLATGELRGCEGHRDLEQRQRNTLRGLANHPAGLGSDRRAEPLYQEELGLVGGESGDESLGKAGAGERAHIPLAGSEQHDDAFCLEASGNERERVRRGLVEPVRIVDQAQERPVGGDLGQEAEHGERDGESVVRITRSDRERAPERRGLDIRYPVEVREHGPQQLVQRRERKLDLRLDADRLEDPQVGAAAAGVAEQC
jgi:hypothetical protein